MASKPATPKKQEPETKVEFALSPANYKYLAIGFGIIILGFVLMSGGGSEDPEVFNAEELFSFRRLTLAPLVILFGFGFEVWAIMRRPKA